LDTVYFCYRSQKALLRGKSPWRYRLGVHFKLAGLLFVAYVAFTYLGVCFGALQVYKSLIRVSVNVRSKQQKTTTTTISMTESTDCMLRHDAMPALVQLAIEVSCFLQNLSTSRAPSDRNCRRITGTGTNSVAASVGKVKILASLMLRLRLWRLANFPIGCE
jgi:hypothetical protein